MDGYAPIKILVTRQDLGLALARQSGPAAEREARVNAPDLHLDR